MVIIWLMIVNNLVGGIRTYPSEKWWSEFVSWDDYSIPNWMASHKKVPVTTNQIIHHIPIVVGIYTLLTSINHY